VSEYQPVTLAGMEALFQSQPGAPLVLIGQPDMDKRQIDNPILVPRMLSFLTYRRWDAHVRGLDSFPQDVWPSNVPLLYYCYHIMVGLGTIFIAISVLAALLLWSGKLFNARWMLWILLLSLPFPYIANTAGWITAEVGRQPWLVYGLLRTADGYSKQVSAGNGLFTLIGFMGMYLVLGLLFIFLVRREVEHGPAESALAAHV
jgi:cytochrome bd ubiquinol oxidase subunit I